MPWQTEPWTDQRREIVRDLWERGYSASRVAHELGVTRNAVIGLVYRNRFPRPAMTKPRRLLHKRPQPRVPKPPDGRIPPAPLARPPPPLGVTLEQLQPQHCRWPAGDRVPYCFCGQPVWGRSSYCLAHHKEAVGR